MLKNISIRRMVTAFAITFIAIVTVAGGAYAAMRALFNPPAPVVPTYIEVVQRPVSSINTNPSNSSSQNTGSGNSENYSPPPEVVTRIARRHPYFFTFLVVGLDDENNNADTIMVGSFDAREQRAHVISLPRDTRVDVQRRQGQRRLAASYPSGRGGGRGHEGGIAQMKSEVQSLIGFEPDFYVTVDFRAFERMVDAVDGVEIYVPRRMYYNHGGTVNINIPAGRQTMDGRTALHFARYRRTITDFGRVENQQKLVAALFSELLTPRTILRVPELISIYNEHVNTNMSITDMLWFANQLTNLGNMEISTYTIPMARTDRQLWYEMPCEEGILELVNRTINPFAQDITAEMLRIVR